jgi:hypothetical protein
MRDARSCKNSAMAWSYLWCPGGKKNACERSIPAARALSRKRARIWVTLTASTARAPPRSDRICSFVPWVHKQLAESFFLVTPTKPANGEEPIAGRIGIGLADGAEPLIEETQHDCRGDLPTERRCKRFADRQRGEVEIAIATRRGRAGGSECERHMTRALLRVEGAGAQSKDCQKLFPRQRPHGFFIPLPLK